MAVRPGGVGGVRTIDRSGILAAHVSLVFAALFAFAIGPVRAEAAAVRLLMVDEVGCRFCARWESDVGGVYAKSAEGRFAPLIRVRRGSPELSALKPATFTPTFIVLKGSDEVGRITGYPGAYYFWEELQALLRPLGFVADAGAGRSQGDVVGEGGP